MWNKIKETVKYNKVLMFFTILFAVIIGLPLVTIAILIPYNFIAINLHELQYRKRDVYF